MSIKGRFLERSSNELLRKGLEGPARISPSEKHCTKRVLIPSLSFRPVKKSYKMFEINICSLVRVFSSSILAHHLGNEVGCLQIPHKNRHFMLSSNSNIFNQLHSTSACLIFIVQQERNVENPIVMKK